jgi:hypothetical protein
MEHFDITKKHHREVRLCKTRAFAAELFAAFPRDPDMESRWRDIAREWWNVAEMKERAHETMKKWNTNWQI